MNVTTVGTPPAPLPAPLLVQRAAASHEAAGAGAHETPQHQAERRRSEPEAPKLPPLKPVTPKEFRVLVGALPVSVLSSQERGGGHLDVYA